MDQYFEPCENCGQCCRIPGIFLPREVDRLGARLHIDREHLFRTYLITELFTPHPQSIPIFLPSPVKTLSGRGRDGKFLSDGQYTLSRDGMCIFRNDPGRSCRIHAHKPFGCTLLICSKMTKAKSLMLNKTYYYHQWLDSQDMLFSVFPGLASLHAKLVKTVFPLPASGRNRRAALTKANAIIHIEMHEMMNGCRSGNCLFYQGPGITLHF